MTQLTPLAGQNKMNRWTERAIIIAALWVLTSGPYLVGWWQQTPNRQYEARIPSNIADTASYFSNIEQARQGRLLFTNQLTSEPQRPSLFQPVWLVTGWLAWLTRLSTPIAFHLARALAVAAFVLVLEPILHSLFPRRRDALIALAVICTSAGFGWFLARHPYPGATILGAPIDIWVDEANTFRSLSHSALFVGSQAILLWLLWSFFRRTQGENVRHQGWRGPALFLLAVTHPYDMVTWLAVSIGWIAVWAAIPMNPRIRVGQVIRATAIDLCWLIPAVAYYLVLPLQQAGVRGWFVQNINPSPTPFALVLGLGLLVPLAMLGGMVLWRRTGQVGLFLWCWAMTTAVISYTPHLAIQRRLLSGLHLPVAILAAAGMLWLIDRLSPPRQRALMMVLVTVFLATTNIKTQQVYIQEIRSSGPITYPIYHSAAVTQALAWQRDHSGLNEVVLADFWSSNEIAGLIARPVVFAHGNQTVAPDDRRRDVEAVFSADTSPADRVAILHRLNVRWLFWVPTNNSRSTYQPSADPEWRQAFANQEVTIFALGSNHS